MGTLGTRKLSARPACRPDALHLNGRRAPSSETVERGPENLALKALKACRPWEGEVGGRGLWNAWRTASASFCFFVEKSLNPQDPPGGPLEKLARTRVMTLSSNQYWLQGVFPVPGLSWALPQPWLGRGLRARGLSQPQ